MLNLGSVFLFVYLFFVCLGFFWYMSNKIRGRGDLKHPVEADQVYFWTQERLLLKGKLTGRHGQTSMAARSSVAGLPGCW